LYKPENEKKPQPLPEDSYFSFQTRSDVQLSVNYDMPGGLPILLEVYGEDPIEYNGKIRTMKAGLQPFFAAYTDMNGRFEGTITVPVGMQKVYLHTPMMGLPDCLELEIIDNTVGFDNSMQIASAETRAYNFGKSIPYHLTGNIYSLCKWTTEGRLFTTSVKQGGGWGGWGFGGTTYEYKDNINPGYITEQKNIPIWDDKGKTRTTEALTSFTSRITRLLWGGAKGKVGGEVDNQRLRGTIDQTNFYIAKQTKVRFMLLHQYCLYKNAVGYYYYKGSGERDVTDLKKFVIFPNTTIVGSYDYKNVTEQILKAGFEVELKFFGEDGTGPAQDEFPEGYTIGWFLIPDGFNRTNLEIKNVDEIMTSNTSSTQQFISVYDEKLRGVIIGIEDGGDVSFEDLLFCVFTDDMDAIIDPKNPGRAYIPKDEDEIVSPPDAAEALTGTWAFEDIWPSGGDYDMNDLIVEYKREVTFDYSNYVKKVIDTFTAKHDGAHYVNAFAAQIAAEQTGKITLPDGAMAETETNSVIFFENSKQAIGKTYTLVREFADATLAKKDLKSLNPFIIVNYEAGNTKRVEVHLPKHVATAFADSSLNYTADDAYYIKKDGKYPFAIDLPVVNFKVVTESLRIDSASEYPDFRAWADSNGATNGDWYLTGK
jgi:LruC domain-containing protein